MLHKDPDRFIQDGAGKASSSLKGLLRAFNNYDYVQIASYAPVATGIGAEVADSSYFLA